MDIRTLENTSIADITATFNEAFRDYFIPLQFTEESMAFKIKSEGILQKYSVGAFEEDRLVGYILHGYDIINGVKTIYNAGTGVIPSFRNRGITSQMYQYAIPLLKKEGICHHLLEVIDNNDPAIKVYERTGFQKRRSLVAYKGTVPAENAAGFSIKELDVIPDEIRSFLGMEAAWQNSLASVARAMKAHTLIGAFEENEMIGFAAYVAATGRVKQCAVHPQHRRRGVGRALFQYIRLNSETEQMVVTNVDEAYEPAIRFLKALNFQPFLRLYEMKMEVKD